MNQALRAHANYKRDVDYAVRDGKVIIVDEFTGRLMHGRRYSEGLHQAIEAKEKVQIERESVTTATITHQNFFRLFKKLSGMTGTAKTEEAEFIKVYAAPVVQIPTHRPVIRQDRPDYIFKTQEGKLHGVTAEILQMQKPGAAHAGRYPVHRSVGAGQRAAQDRPAAVVRAGDAAGRRDGAGDGAERHAAQGIGARVPGSARRHPPGDAPPRERRLEN